MAEGATCASQWLAELEPEPDDAVSEGGTSVAGVLPVGF